MTRPAEHAHDAATGVPAEGASVGKSELGEDAIPNADHPLVTGEIIDANTPAVDPAVAEKATHGYIVATDSLIDPYPGEKWDGGDVIPVTIKKVTEKAAGYNAVHGVGIYDLHGKPVSS